MTIKKFKVIENYSTTEGTLYQGEVLKEDNNNTLEDHKRLKDSMGKVWFVPHKYIVRIWTFFDSYFIFICDNAQERLSVRLIVNNKTENKND